MNVTHPLMETMTLEQVLHFLTQIQQNFVGNFKETLDIKEVQM